LLAPEVLRELGNDRRAVEWLADHPLEITILKRWTYTVEPET
jgi:hypothetical protein